MSATTWKDPRRILIRIPSTGQFEPELVVGFEVTKLQAPEFEKLLTEYLKFCEGKEALIRVKDEVTDSSTGEPCSITIDILGARQAAAQEMQRVGNTLMQHSRRVR